MRNMIDSGVLWIGEIPENWETQRLQWMIEEINVSNNPVQTEEILSLTIEAGVIPYSEKGNQGNKAKEDCSQYKIAFPNTLVVNSMNVIIGAVGISNYYGCVSPVYYVFKAKDNADLRYIYYLFTNVGFQKEMRKYAKGILEIRLRISSNDMLKRIIPKPSYEEQCRIADFLDRKCAEIDRVIADTQRTIEEYKALKQSIITEAVTKGVRGPRPMKDSGVAWIGEIPETWDCKPIKYVALFQPTCNTSLLREDSEITYTPMDYIKNGFFIQNTAKFGSVASSLTPYENGDIVMAKVTPCFENGNIAIMNNLSSGFGMGSSELFVYRPFAINTRFLLYWLQNDLFKQAACATMTGTGGLKRVSPYFAKNSKITVPSDGEQNQIVEYLDSKCQEINRLIESKQQFLSELETYKKSVIYEFVTGKKTI